ncbi:MAG: hypothetical protein II881_08755 [Oscillospiraceae bacterium]|nr:hypothetical protein [Oscillospiraceae bacterium]MBQ9898469.1 hypothetical protein [Ruminococcus sp.]
MKRILRDRSGSIPLLFYGLLFALLGITFVILEMGYAFEKTDYATDVIQRCVNSAVERNMLDEYRQDGILLLDTDSAEKDFRYYLGQDVTDGYSITVDSISAYAGEADGSRLPSMTVEGTISFETLMNTAAVRYPFRVRATNYDTTDFELDRSY